MICGNKDQTSYHFDQKGRGSAFVEPPCTFFAWAGKFFFKSSDLRPNFYKNGDLGASAMSTVVQMEGGRDLEIVLILVITKRMMTASVSLSLTIFRRETTPVLM